MSSLKQNGGSSESDERYVMMDEKKKKRMISNRESARRSRMRKKKQMQDLTKEVGRLQLANKGIVGKIEGITEKYMICAAKNNVLTAQVMELTERLKSINDVMRNCGLRMDATQAPDLLLKPWQLPCTMQPIHAASGLFHL